MAKQVLRRKNKRLLGWLSAGTVAVATYAGLLGLQVGPAWLAAALALAAGVLTLAATDLGVLVAIFSLSLPMMAVSPVAGLLFLIIGVIGIRYLGSDGGSVFFFVAAAIAGAFFGPVWAVAALAGYILGASEGALAAAVAVLTVEALGLALGQGSIGPVVTGGAAPGLFDLARMPASLASMEWVKASFGTINADAVNATIGAISSASNIGLLAIQPLIAGLTAIVTGMAVRGEGVASRPALKPLIVAGCSTLPALGAAVLAPALGAAVPMAAIATAAVSSAVVTAGFVLVWERLFPMERIEVAAPKATGMAAEDADVDELLRLISTAEDELTTKHTTNATVMITDMKSFSRMTEEDGSILSAKAIQRHRDLLLPVIEKNGGHGKSTGGDGLIAAFGSPAAALSAAAEMQRVMNAHNLAHPNERELTVRIGVADGEVVLDKSGRPFIGAALNLAARVMNLADGGQSFATLDVAAKAGGAVTTHSHGRFELKNIASPVEVVEVLWAEDQEPRDPRDRTAA